MPVAHLEDRAVIAITGPEARPFLQGLITNDVERLAPGKGLYAALLTPQGKILFDFFLIEGDGAILIDCLAASRDLLLKRLTMYKLRSRISIESRDQLAVLAEWDGASAPYAISYPDPRLPDLGRRAVIAKGEMRRDLMPSSAYLEHRLAHGVPEGSDFGSDRMFALDADLDELHAVDFNKGCYVGQELTARMKHRSTARKRLLPLMLADGGAHGTSITANGKEVGEITSEYGERAFASMRVDRLEQAKHVKLLSGDREVNVITPSWLFP